MAPENTLIPEGAIAVRSIVENPSLLRVKNSGIVRLQYFPDYPDGNLIIGEELKDVPFEIKRFYYIQGFDKSKAIRGKHAHRKLKQLIMCINGSFTLVLDDGKIKQEVAMNDPTIGVVLDGLLWHEMKDFSDGCAILVLANDYYDPADYVRDYQEFLGLVK